MAQPDQPRQSEQPEQPNGCEQPNEFEAVKLRLEEIARAVDDESLSLDDALDLYEEAVKLGLQASNLLETGVVVEEESPDEPAGADASASDSPQADSGASAAVPTLAN